MRHVSAAAVMVFAFAGQGAQVGPGPELSTGGGPGGAMVGIPAVSPSNHADVGEMFLCLTEPGRAVITNVQPVQPVGGVEVVAFAVRPNPTLKGANMLGSGTGALESYGFDTLRRAVDAQCVSGSGQGSELGLELTIPPGTNASTRSFQIDYTVGHHHASLIYPVGAVLCSTPTVDDPPCKGLFQRLGIVLGPI